MSDDLLDYYNRELAFLRRTGADFARQYPKVAGRLLLEPAKCEDPHVERLLEGFAFLAARVHHRIDDDFPEISEALLDIIFPQYTRPIPSMSVVQFQLDPEQGKSPAGIRIARETELFSRPVGGSPCQFRTCYDTTLWPLEVKAARWTAPGRLDPPVRAGEAVAALRIELQCLPDMSFRKLDLDTLRLHISAEGNLAASIYELLFNNCTEIILRDLSAGSTAEPVVLPGTALRPVGFEEDEAMLPHSPRAFSGYRLLQEYFTFPDKFLFLDLPGFAQARAAGFGNRMEVVFLISAFERAERKQLLEIGINETTFRSGCSPIVNIFPQTSDGILLRQRQPEYQIVPDARRRTTLGIYSVEDVVAVTPGSDAPLRFEPLYSSRHGADAQGRPRLYWRASRRSAVWRNDEETEVWLSLVDLEGQLVHPDLDAATVRLLCHNGNLPSRLPFGSGDSDFETRAAVPVRKIVALVKPTQILRPALGKSQLWRLISQLSLNYMSLVDGGVNALRELLRLHNFADSVSVEKQIQGILKVEAGPHYSRIESPQGLAFARGHKVRINFDEEQFAGGGAFLMASVLERFLGVYVSLNSFCVLEARTPQRRNVMREWKPRSGTKVLL
ncbi:MAG: type VI secretion system baseplate subunit TssF [Gemmatimonadota bacterium]|jgi:type VI secretion system protein ImpG|nr:type VI secretion system baseplate subunit TssF [Gemmatimonadota bacterium]